MTKEMFAHLLTEIIKAYDDVPDDFRSSTGQGFYDLVEGYFLYLNEEIENELEAWYDKQRDLE